MVASPLIEKRRVQSLDPFDHHSDFWAGQSIDPHRSTTGLLGRILLALFYKNVEYLLNRILFENGTPGSVPLKQSDIFFLHALRTSWLIFMAFFVSYSLVPVKVIPRLRLSSSFKFIHTLKTSVFKLRSPGFFEVFIPYQRQILLLNADEPPPTLHYSVSNRSKFPLTGLGLLTRESGKRKQNISNVANSPESVITSCSKQPFPKLTVSPLRKFQLIDSDYDSNIPSICKVNKTYNKSEPYLNRGKSIGLDQPGKLSESLL
ncbi:hypothetical protein Tco_0363995 [Tanacetum coccineum]